MDVFAVVPILPTLTSLAVIVPVLLLSILTALASLRKPDVARSVLRLVWRQKLQLLIVVGLILGAVRTFGWVSARLTRSVAPAQRSGPDWPMHRGSLKRHGWVAGDKGPSCGGVVWSGGRPAEAFYASPAVVGNRVFCVGSRNDAGRIYCWDADTGDRIWSSAPSGYRATFSSPVVAGDYLVCGEGLHHTRLARVVCLDVRPGSEGHVLWTFQTNSHVECTPFIYRDRVYVGAGDDGIYCLRLDPDIPDESRAVWHAPGDRFPDAETSLVAHEGKVYVGLGVGGNALCVLEAESGKEIGRLSMPYPVFGPPAIDQGRLYVGMGNADYVNSTDESAGCVCCVDLGTFGVEWSFDTPAAVLGAIAVDDDQLVFGCCDGRLYVLDHQGKQVRSWDSHSPLLASPTLTDRFVYVVNRAGMLHALDRRWLEPVWEVSLGQPGLYLSSPVVARGRVFVGTEHDGLLCVGEPAADVDTAIWPGHLGGPGAAGCRDGSSLPQDARVLWELRSPTGGESTVEVTAPVAATANSVLVPVADGGRFGMACLDMAEAVKENPHVRWSVDTPNAITQSPAIVGKRAFLVDGQVGSPNRNLHCIDMSLGRVLWRRVVEPLASGVLTVDHAGIFVQDGLDALSQFTVEDENLWTIRLGVVTRCVHTGPNILVAAVDAPPSLAAIDRPSGRLLWRVALDTAPTTAPSVRNNRIFLGADSGLESRSLVDGHRLWHMADDRISSLYVDSDKYVYVNANGHLVTGSPDDGSVFTRTVGAVAGLNPLVGQNEIVFVGTTGLSRVPLRREAVAAIEQLGLLDANRINTPLVLHGGRIYVGVAGRGLVCVGGDPAQ
ncbi:MAG: PQQ-binding-like beta-propeller repeat protein [Planctomycetes bacterium]|nr:PQQ-binding-like beta-propeller repeat protein [Planctomycetota bacterium]MBL7038860.1 PQQ-binding-like beta-propeller repeat protein [Pirellulaceae bacterium]